MIGVPCEPQQGEIVPDALPGRVAPLGWQHINPIGDYLWDADADVALDGFRTLRGGTQLLADAAERSWCCRT